MNAGRSPRSLLQNKDPIDFSNVPLQGLACVLGIKLLPQAGRFHREQAHQRIALLIMSDGDFLEKSLNTSQAMP